MASGLVFAGIIGASLLQVYRKKQEQYNFAVSQRRPLPARDKYEGPLFGVAYYTQSEPVALSKNKVSKVQ